MTTSTADCVKHILKNPIAVGTTAMDWKRVMRFKDEGIVFRMFECKTTGKFAGIVDVGGKLVLTHYDDLPLSGFSKTDLPKVELGS